MAINFINTLDDYENLFPIFVKSVLDTIYSEIYKDNSNHVLVDIGANAGVISEIFLNYTDKIVSIDAHPKWLEIFSCNKNPKIIKYNIGCYSTKTEKNLIADVECTGLGFIGLPPDAEKFKKLTSTYKKYKVQCDTLDNILSEFCNEKVILIKIDAESSDFEIILGAATIIKKDRPFLIFEFSGQTFEKAHKRNKTEFFNFFQENNYLLYSVIDKHTVKYIFSRWDTYSPELRDILAVPAEFKHLVDNLEYIHE